MFVEASGPYKDRVSMKHDIVVELLFCYVSLRLLENYDKDALNTVEDVVVMPLRLMTWLPSRVQHPMHPQQMM